MGHRKKRVVTTVSGNAITQQLWYPQELPSRLDTQLMWGNQVFLRDPTRAGLIYVNGDDGDFTFKEPYKEKLTKFQEVKKYIKKMATDLDKAWREMIATTAKYYTPQYLKQALVSEEALKRQAELEEMILQNNHKQQLDREEAERKRKENLEIKGVYREKLKALTDENVALKHELQKLKDKYESVPY